MATLPLPRISIPLAPSRGTLLLLLASTLGSLASAQILPTGPFVGCSSESFETQPASTFSSCVIGGVFASAGSSTLCNTGGSTIISTGHVFGCTIFPHSGGHLLVGGTTGALELTFDPPVTAFGGWFGNNSGWAGGQVIVFDPDGVQIGAPFGLNLPSDCGWYWNGWRACEGRIGKLTITGNNPSAPALLCLDDLQILGCNPPQLTPVGPFTGCDSENFESFPLFTFYSCLTGGILNASGGATLCNPSGGMNTPSGHVFGCTTNPHSGSRLLVGGIAGSIEITFSQAVTSFGGWFAVPSGVGSAGGTATFYDSTGTRIGNPVAITAPANCSWNWNGWTVSSGSIRKVVITGNNPAMPAQMLLDDLQILGCNPCLIASSFCPGDGSAGNCPCSPANNATTAGHGCANSSTTAGGLLEVTGCTNPDTLMFEASDLYVDSTCLLLGGTVQITPVPYGDGLRCVSGQFLRMYTTTTFHGETCFPTPNTPPIRQRMVQLGLTPAPGQTVFYQAIYRDPSPCNALVAKYNMTNGQKVTW